VYANPYGSSEKEKKVSATNIDAQTMTMEKKRSSTQIEWKSQGESKTALKVGEDPKTEKKQGSEKDGKEEKQLKMKKPRNKWKQFCEISVVEE